MAVIRPTKKGIVSYLHPYYHNGVKDPAGVTYMTQGAAQPSFFINVPLKELNHGLPFVKHYKMRNLKK